MASQNAVLSSPTTSELPLQQPNSDSRTFDPATLPGDLDSRLDRSDIVTLEVSEEQLVDLMRQLRRPEEDIQNVRDDASKKQTSYHIVAGLDVRIGEHLWNDGAHGQQIALYGTAEKLTTVSELLLNTPEYQPRWYEQSEQPETNSQAVSTKKKTGEKTMAAKRSSKKGEAVIEVDTNTASVESNGAAAPAPTAEIKQNTPVVGQAKPAKVTDITSTQVERQLDAMGDDTFRAANTASVESNGAAAPAPTAEIKQNTPVVEQAKPTQATDITSTQVKRQLDAMGNDTFRVAIRGPEGIKNTYELTAEELLKKVPYLKLMNVQGNDILVKPIGESNVVMIDGLSKDQMNAMHVSKGGPAVALQVTPDTYQAFVKVGDEPIPAQQRREIGKELAERFGGDQKAVAEGHYGRLAGFTNRDPGLIKEDKKQPWVKVQSSKGEGLDQQEAAELLTSANVRVEEINKLLEQTRNQAIESFRDAKAGPGQLNPNSPNADATVAFKTTAARLFERYGEGFDEVKADWLIAKDMAQKGWGKKEIARAIEDGSANVEPRKFDAMKDYANRTAGRAVAAVENERAVDRSKSMDRGVER